MKVLVVLGLVVLLLAGTLLVVVSDPWKIARAIGVEEKTIEEIAFLTNFTWQLTKEVVKQELANGVF